MVSEKTKNYCHPLVEVKITQGMLQRPHPGGHSLADVAEICDADGGFFGTFLFVDVPQGQ